MKKRYNDFSISCAGQVSNEKEHHCVTFFTVFLLAAVIIASLGMTYPGLADNTCYYPVQPQPYYPQPYYPEPYYPNPTPQPYYPQPYYPQPYYPEPYYPYPSPQPYNPQPYYPQPTPTPAPKVDLTTLSPYYTSNNYFQVMTGIRDIMGNYYNTGIRSYADHIGGQWDSGETYWVWDIGGKYTRLTAKGIIREEDKGMSKNLSGIVRIYGDGRLLYQKTNITSDTKPYDIEVNISGVQDLKLEMYGQSSTLGFSGIDAVLVDIMLQ